MKAKCFIIEENFLKSVLPVSYKRQGNYNENYFLATSYFLDTKSPHFFPGTISSIEHSIVNSKVLSAKEYQHSKEIINLLKKHKLSKYNCQPLSIKPIFTKGNHAKILIVDQAYRDFSVIISGGGDDSFKDMLNSAIDENPDAEIVIKTHVDKAGNTTYFSEIDVPPNVCIFSEEVNPMSMIEEADKVYTYSSAMGLEALLLNKEVHVFGAPIYAGWGLTHDRRSFKHRRNTLKSIEDLIHQLYVKKAIYIDYQTNAPCQVINAIEGLVNMRDQYFNESG
jgi:capsular polysaccharide export protein